MLEQGEGFLPDVGRELVLIHEDEVLARFLSQEHQQILVGKRSQLIQDRLHHVVSDQAGVSRRRVELTEERLVLVDHQHHPLVLDVDGCAIRDHLLHERLGYHLARRQRLPDAHVESPGFVTVRCSARLRDDFRIAGRGPQVEAGGRLAAPAHTAPEPHTVAAFERAEQISDAGPGDVEELRLVGHLKGEFPSEVVGDRRVPLQFAAQSVNGLVPYSKRAFRDV